MANRQIKIEFLGDAASLSKSTRQVTEDLDKVGPASKNAADGLDRAGEAADTLDTRAMGFRDTMTGVQDTMLGVGDIARGNLFEGFFTLGMGLGDLGSGIYNLVVPAFKALKIENIKNAAATVKATIANTAHRISSAASAVASKTLAATQAFLTNTIKGNVLAFKALLVEKIKATVATVRQTVATVAHKVAMVASAAATKAMAIAQRLLNAALRANPIGLVITAIAALATGFVILYKKNETFREAINALWNKVLKPLGTFIGGVLVKTLATLGKAWLKMAEFALRALATLVKFAVKAFDGILAAAEASLGWVPGLGSKLKGAREKFNEFGDKVVKELERAADKAKAMGKALDDATKDRTVTVTIVTKGDKKWANGGREAPTRTPAGRMSADSSVVVSSRAANSPLVARSAGAALAMNAGTTVIQINGPVYGDPRAFAKFILRELRAEKRLTGQALGLA